MRIGRFVKSSLSAWKGKNVCVIEVRGSHTRSPAAADPVLFEYEGPCIDEEEVFDFISQHTDVLEGIVIAGGEPFMQSDLYLFLKKLKAVKLPVMIRTEGMCPDSLDDLAGACMFAKAGITIPYGDMCQEDEGKLLRSLKILADSDIEYEAMFYAAPGFDGTERLKSVAKTIGPKGTLLIISVDPEKTPDPQLNGRKPLKKKDALVLHGLARKYAKKVEVRGF